MLKKLLALFGKPQLPPGICLRCQFAIFGKGHHCGHCHCCD